MKVHVFVATTQGLVAIQRIYPQDAEIRSVVSINGTATVSAISSAYHHFVRKGVGIIEKDFGGGAYRVNIAAQIDQGNSWQLGFYLAHAACAQNILGDGNPQPGDRVICATGEINTSEKSVLAVKEIPLKIQRASAQIHAWPKDIQRYFLLPKSNASEWESQSNLSAQLYWIDSLETALKYLPANHENGLNPGPKNDRAELSIKVKLMLKGFFHKPIYPWITLGTALLAGMLVYFAGGSPEKGAVDTGSQDTLVDQAQISELVTVHVDDLSASRLQASLRLGYADNDEEGDEKKCQGAELDYRELPSVTGVFKPAPFTNLCAIRFVPEHSYSTLYVINRVSHRFVRATLIDKVFDIPLPGMAADYLLLAVKSQIQKEHHRQLHGYLFNLADETIIHAQDLNRLPALQGLDYEIFSHQLTLK